MTNSDYYCPRTHELLRFAEGDSILENSAGDRYPVVDGIPHLLLELGQERATSRDQDYYRTRVAEYDAGMEVMFRMLLSDEHETREEMIEPLEIVPGCRILEIGCGTCRDTRHLLSRGAFVYAGDLSHEMVAAGRHRLQTDGIDFSHLRLFVGEATQLPFPDGFFDGAFHFGGLNAFPDIALALREMSRVVKPGGRVVGGDEGVGTWLSDTDFARILENSNPLFRNRAPIDKVPVTARNVACKWILNGSFYLLMFDVGQGEPQLDLDVTFPGWRGGSHRSRYYGKLEGVAPGLRERVIKAAAAEGVQVVAWLERALAKALGEKPN